LLRGGDPLLVLKRTAVIVHTDGEVEPVDE
jgi:hypothetical protein